MTRVTVTGAAGFVGQGVVRVLAEAGFGVRAVIRSLPAPGVFPDKVEVCRIAGLPEDVDGMCRACSGADLVVHLADNPERGDAGSGSAALARTVAEAAQHANVPRIVFASSIYASLDERGQRSDYGAGKREAERIFSEAAGVDAVSLRLPPVYGPGGKGGFAMVTKLVQRDWPLPFGLAKAKRAYLSRDNLAALIVALAQADDAAFRTAAGRVWEPSDTAVSTAELARAVAAAIGKRPLLLPVPRALLLLPAALAGKRAGVEAIFSSLECAEDGRLRELTGWRPSSDLVANLAYLRG